MDKPLLEVDNDQKKRILELLARSEVFDHFLQAKFPNLKRVSFCRSGRNGSFMPRFFLKYGLEGGESMIPALDILFSSAAQGTHSYLCRVVHTN
jgi:probable 2-oxoglutarate dehydrogenase E1 component DHKTD1